MEGPHVKSYLLTLCKIIGERFEEERIGKMEVPLGGYDLWGSHNVNALFSTKDPSRFLYIRGNSHICTPNHLSLSAKLVSADNVMSARRRVLEERQSHPDYETITDAIAQGHFLYECKDVPDHRHEYGIYTVVTDKKRTVFYSPDKHLNHFINFLKDKFPELKPD